MHPRQYSPPTQYHLQYLEHRTTVLASERSRYILVGAALHGTTLEQLNRIWLSGTSVKLAIFSIRHVKRIGVASLFTTVATLSAGPLLQRASRPKLLTLPQEVDMEIYLPDKLPAGFAGKSWYSNEPSLPGNTLLSPEFFRAIQAWSKQAPIVALNNSGFWCVGTCEGTVQGAGISKTTLHE